MKRLPLFVCLLLFFLPSVASAQAFQLQAQTDVDTVAVGDVVHLELTAQSGDGMPTEPQPGGTPGFTVRGQSSSPSQTHISINGNRIDRFGLTVDWTLQAQRPGVFTLGPPSVIIGGVRHASHALTVRVVASGQAPPRSTQQPPTFPQAPPGAPPGFSPFNSWRSLFPGMDPSADDSNGPSVTTDPKLAVEAPRGALYFLHATVDNPSAVVGQQVTFTVYEYLDASTGGTLEVDGSDVRDPSVADFVKHPLLHDDQQAIMAGFASINGHIWKVSVVRRWALFPLRAGDLDIAPMSVTLLRPRSVAGSQRTTEALRVHVTDPPAAGRPTGYALGDTGRFSLTAQVTPRDLEQGGAVGVHVELSGAGNVPAAITPPARAGVEWLAPEVHEQLGNVGHDTFGGKRTFDYVVRILQGGDVSLGELTLPYWDPDQKHYVVARASLGTLHVKASATPAGSANALDQELLAGLPPPREALEGTAPSRVHADDRPLFWLFGVGAWPAAFGIAVAGRATGRWFARAWQVRRASPLTELRDRVNAANAASGGADPRALDAAVARALAAATITHAQVNVRGAVGDGVVQRLEGAGVTCDLATEIAEMLRECEAARFSPDAADLSSARDRWERARGIIRRLEKR